MKRLSDEELEEYRQVDTRIVTFMTQANRLTAGYVIAFFGFLTWMTSTAGPIPLLPTSALVAFGLFFGLALINFFSLQIEKERSYKIVFIERNTETLFYERSRLSKFYLSFDRTRLYGSLGLLIHVMTLVVFFFDPVNKFSSEVYYREYYAAAFTVPGTVYSLYLLTSKHRLTRFIEMWERIKQDKQDGGNTKPRKRTVGDSQL